jgi:glycosyltransferase involved in cell wall biosynthesis
MGDSHFFTHFFLIFLRPVLYRSTKNVYADCDVWLFASFSEGFGLPIIEAMACRCPVVATRAGCAPDVIKEGVNGY